MNNASLDGDVGPSHLHNQLDVSLLDAVKFNDDAAAVAEEASVQHPETSTVLHHAFDKSHDESSVASILEPGIPMRERTNHLQPHDTCFVDLLVAAVVIAVTSEEIGSIFNIIPGFLCSAEMIGCSFVCFNCGVEMQCDSRSSAAAAAAAEADIPAVTASSEAVITSPAREIVNQSRPSNPRQQQHESARESIAACAALSQGAAPLQSDAVADNSNSYRETSINQFHLPSPSSWSAILPASTAATESAVPKSTLSLRERMNM
jgi:hypothetical protein